MSLEIVSREPGVASDLVRGAGWPGLCLAKLGGPFGHTAKGLALLEALAEATDLGMAAAAGLTGRIREDTGFTETELGRTQRALVGALQVVVMADLVVRRLGAPTIEGAFDPDGLGDLLELERAGLVRRVLRLIRGFADTADDLSAATVAGFELLRRAVQRYAETGTMLPLLTRLERVDMRVDGRPWRGLVSSEDNPHRGLLSVWPTDIVGNDAYLAAGQRLARDVAAFDFGRKRSPKKIQPVLFGLGRPGCGKTVTAHAIGNYFLDYCAQREVPATFRVIRRTDWASSYQNASAANLVHLFKELHSTPGVVGIYWPDIDTAIASREAPGLRMEEKQTLGALFGVFDGTLLPKDGRWFLICDANSTRMDPAAMSRIAQQPHTVKGPTTPAEYVRLMRDVLLREVKASVCLDDRSWVDIGAQLAEHALSGRAVEAIAGRVRAQIEDFELPDAWFTASDGMKDALLDDLRQPVAEADIEEAIGLYQLFHAEADARAREDRFQREVDELVDRLNATREAAALVARV